MTEGEAPPLKASDADRERTLEQLRDAATDGRLTFEELADRAEMVNAARSRDELAAATADLGEAAPATSAEPTRHVAVLSSIDRRGRWRIEPASRFTSVLGSIRLDLSDAVIPGPDIEIEVVSVLGSTELIVPEGVHVDVSGTNVLSGRMLDLVGTPPPGAPTLHVRATGVLGSLSIRTRGRGMHLGLPGLPTAPPLPRPPGSP
jgi:hypothetical protein